MRPARWRSGLSFSQRTPDESAMTRSEASHYPASHNTGKALLRQLRHFIESVLMMQTVTSNGTYVVSEWADLGRRYNNLHRRR
jgi:hypothetical protein